MWVSEGLRVTPASDHQREEGTSGARRGPRWWSALRTPSGGEAAVVVDETAEYRAGHDLSFIRVHVWGLRWQMPG